MIRLKYYKIKKIKLNQLISKDKNLLNLNVFFNFAKFRHKKWNILRSIINKENDTFVFARFNLNNIYHQYVETNALNERVKPFLIGIQTYETYKDMLVLKQRVLSFFGFIREKSLKKLLIHRNFSYRFDSFDHTILFLLLRLGFISNLKLAKKLISTFGIGRGNQILQDPYRPLNFEDIIKPLWYCKFKIYFVLTYYDKKLKKYMAKRKRSIVNFFDYYRILSFNRWNQKKFQLVNYSKDLLVNKVLPMPFPVNYANMSFYFIPFQLKNQHTAFFNMFLIKKFLQYNR